MPQARVGLVERMGRYRRTIPPGVNLVAPFIDRVRLIDTRDQELDLPPTRCRTADGTALTVDTRLRYRVIDPVKAAYEIADFPEALAQVTASALRTLTLPAGAPESRARELTQDLHAALVSGTRT